MLNHLDEKERADITQLLRMTGNKDESVAFGAQKLIAAELTTPIRQGVLDGDIIGNIFVPTTFDPGAAIQYPIDFFRPDNSGDFRAYTVPGQGRVPERNISGDYINVPTYEIANSIDFLIKYAREARWDIVTRALEVLQVGFTKKLNDDGWHVIFKAMVDRGILVYDANAAAGQFTKRLVSLMKLVMRRNAGGNSTSVNRGRLTHLYLSPEAIEDVRNWGIDEVDPVTRREIYVADDGTFNKVFGVTLVDLDELGEGQEYQKYFTTTLGGTMGTSDVETCVGLDLSHNDSFVMPVDQPLEIFADPIMHRSGRIGYYGRMSQGLAVLNGVRVLSGSL